MSGVEVIAEVGRYRSVATPASLAMFACAALVGSEQLAARRTGSSMKWKCPSACPELCRQDSVPAHKSTHNLAGGAPAKFGVGWGCPGLLGLAGLTVLGGRGI